MGWTLCILFWCAVIFGIVFVFPIVIAGFVMLIGGLLAAASSAGGGDGD